MCRIFAIRSEQALSVYESLLGSPHCLARQSVCDRRGECHDNGWGIGYYADGEPVRARSVLPAASDERYRTLAKSVVAPCVLAHIRKASTGSVTERNTHPFQHGRWLFAHNGTLFGFDTDPGRLRRLIPAQLRCHIGGETDSEHAFYSLLGHLENYEQADTEELVHALTRTLHLLAELYPGRSDERSQFNFVITDGRLMAVSRWGHSLCFVERRRDGAGNARAIAIASEATTDEEWTEIPDRSVLFVTPNISLRRAVIG